MNTDKKDLIKYLSVMISQESCALSSLCLANDEENCNHEPIMSVFKRLSAFISDYDEYTRTGDIINKM